MNDEELRLKVAELCGWKDIKKWDNGAYWTGIRPRRKYEDEAQIGMHVPDFANDLNSCVEFESSLDNGQSGLYSDHLQDALKVYLVGYTEGEYFTDLKKLKDIICATPRQRCEAFIKTMEGE